MAQETEVLVDTALLRHPLDAPLEDEKGLLLEHLVAYELHRRMGSLWPEAKLFHYPSRDSEGVRLSGLESLQDRVGRLGRKIVVFLGKRKQARDGVEFLPLEDFLTALPG